MGSYIYKGYYLRRRILCEDELKTVKIESFFEIEIDDSDETFPYTDASDFLMGSCQLFATELNKKYGYPIYEVNLNGRMIHCFCKVDIGKTVYYVDVRGVTNDFSEFLLETNVSKDDDFIIQEYKVDSSDKWDDIGLKFAQLLIDRNPEYYEI